MNRAAEVIILMMLGFMIGATLMVVIKIVQFKF